MPPKNFYRAPMPITTMKQIFYSKLNTNFEEIWIPSKHLDWFEPRLYVNIMISRNRLRECVMWHITTMRTIWPIKRDLLLRKTVDHTFRTDFEQDLLMQELLCSFFPNINIKEILPPFHMAVGTLALIIVRLGYTCIGYKRICT
jgi:hypothetical protein